MKYKVMWCVEIKGYNLVDIHGRVYVNSKEEAILRLKEVAFEDYEKLKAKDHYHKWHVSIHETGLNGDVCGVSGCADDWDQEIGVHYRVAKRRIPV